MKTILYNLIVSLFIIISLSSCANDEKNIKAIIAMAKDCNGVIEYSITIGTWGDTATFTCSDFTVVKNL